MTTGRRRAGQATARRPPSRRADGDRLDRVAGAGERVCAACSPLSEPSTGLRRGAKASLPVETDDLAAGTPDRCPGSGRGRGQEQLAQVAGWLLRPPAPSARTGLGLDLRPQEPLVPSSAAAGGPERPPGTQSSRTCRRGGRSPPPRGKDAEGEDLLRLPRRITRMRWRGALAAGSSLEVVPSASPSASLPVETEDRLGEEARIAVRAAMSSVTRHGQDVLGAGQRRLGGRR